MTLLELWQFVNKNPLFIIIAVCSLIEITPIKINPWARLLCWVGGFLNIEVVSRIKDLENRIQEIEKNQKNFQKHQNQKWADDCRWNILDFADSCKLKRRHTKETWEHVMSQLHEYEEFCDINSIDNDRITEETKYLRKLYADIVHTNDWLIQMPEEEENK